VHQRVIDELRKKFAATGRMNPKVFASLDIMRRLRVQADYELRQVIPENDVENMFELFDACFGECKRLLELMI